VKVRVEVVEEFVLPLKLTDQEVPEGNPDSVKVTVYVDLMGVTWVNVMVFVTLAPLTGMLPDEGLAVYPTTEPTVNEYPVVLLSIFENTMLGVVDELADPLKVTAQLMPDGRPDSVKVTEYREGGMIVKVIF
jgi:hypothetical protein